MYVQGEEDVKAVKSFYHLKLGDYLVFLLYFTIIIFTFFAVISLEKPEFVEIRYGSSTWIYPLDSSLEIQPVDEEGTCRLLIENNTVRVISSSCPLKICIQTGAIKKVNEWIACLPHKILISITGSGELTEQNELVIDSLAY